MDLFERIDKAFNKGRVTNYEIADDSDEADAPDDAAAPTNDMAPQADPKAENNWGYGKFDNDVPLGRTGLDVQQRAQVTTSKTQGFLLDKPHQYDNARNYFIDAIGNAEKERGFINRKHQQWSKVRVGPFSLRNFSVVGGGVAILAGAAGGGLGLIGLAIVTQLYHRHRKQMALDANKRVSEKVGMFRNSEMEIARAKGSGAAYTIESSKVMGMVEPDDQSSLHGMFQAKRRSNRQWDYLNIFGNKKALVTGVAGIGVGAFLGPTIIPALMIAYGVYGAVSSMFGGKLTRRDYRQSKERLAQMKQNAKDVQAKGFEQPVQQLNHEFIGLYQYSPDKAIEAAQNEAPNFGLNRKVIQPIRRGLDKINPKIKPWKPS